MSTGDLHIHSSASDGLVAPAVVARMAADAGLGFFALADHNSVCGLPRHGRALAADRPRLIPGVELSSQPGDGEEIHILGYGVDPANPTLRGVCRELVTRKREQMLEILGRLRGEGIEVDPQALALEDLERYPGRPALAELLVSDGVVRSAGEAFGRYLSRGAVTFVPMRPFSPALCIDAIHEAGGLAALAHPFIPTVDRHLGGLVTAGPGRHRGVPSEPGRQRAALHREGGRPLRPLPDRRLRLARPRQGRPPGHLQRVGGDAGGLLQRLGTF